MTLRENVLKLQEIELKATPVPWNKWHQAGIDGAEYCIRLHSGYNIIGINECDRNAIVDLRNAARGMLDVLSCFREGDVRCLKAIRGILHASMGPDTWSEEMGCIERMIEAARRMEG